MATERIAVPMDAGRVCEAIARIGYSPAAALMDIVDNSVAAGARKVTLEFKTDPDGTYAQSNNVLHYRVFDDGAGMSDEEIVNALQLGSAAEYPEGSLSKYGMGLKAAGFSLGAQIRVLSKKEGALSCLNYLDPTEMANGYVVCREDPPACMVEDLTAFLGDGGCGTLVEIIDCQSRRHCSARKTIDQLEHQLGVVYYTFLKREDNPLSIVVRCSGKPDISVSAFDMLFLEQATEGFDPDEYDCKTPCLVHDGDLCIAEGVQPVRLKVVLFPKDKMKAHASLTQEERDQIKAYQVNRKNNGFFVYRNGRLIRWGDDLRQSGEDPIVGRDLIGFRARLTLETQHDDLLHVDVSKQRLSIPEEILRKIETAVRIARREAKEIFEKCDERLKIGEGAAFNERNQDLVEEDTEATGSGTAKETRRTRKQALEAATATALAAEGEVDGTPEPEETVSETPLFARVRYSDTVNAMLLWEPGTHPVDGTFVRINKNHAFYTTVLARLNEGAAERQAIEGIIWACAASENLTITNLLDLDDEVIRAVFDKFKRLVCTNVDSWATTNQDIFDDE